MISGIGIDAVSLERVKKLDRHFLEKVYNEHELEEYALLENAHEDVKAQFLSLCSQGGVCQGLWNGVLRNGRPS